MSPRGFMIFALILLCTNMAAYGGASERIVADKSSKLTGSVPPDPFDFCGGAGGGEASGASATGAAGAGTTAGSGASTNAVGTVGGAAVHAQDLGAADGAGAFPRSGALKVGRHG